MAGGDANGETINGGGDAGKGKYTGKYDPEETDPLKKNKDNNGGITDITVSLPEDDDIEAAAATAKNGGTKNESAKLAKTATFKDRCDGLLEKYEVSKKAKKIISILIVLLVVLIAALIILIILWPSIPDYMKMPVCADRECLDASAQILDWSNQTVNVCDNPYEWACGKFENHFQQHNFYERSPGEWNLKKVMHYNDIEDIRDFLSKLPTANLERSAQSIVTELNVLCWKKDSIQNTDAVNSLKKDLSNLLNGWKILTSLHQRWSPTNWHSGAILANIQQKHPWAPFFKIRVVTRPKPPYDNIISISEADYGLPNREFYKLVHNHPIRIAYEVLLRDIAINLGVVGDKAKRFAEEIFNYEKRIVESTQEAHNNANASNIIRTLKEVSEAAPSLPISDSIKMILAQTQITDKTELIVENLEALRAMSNIFSSSDTEVLNNYFAWYLIRNYIPYLSTEERSPLNTFEFALYGYKTAQPNWFTCAELIRKWMPFAIRSLQQNSNIRTEIGVPLSSPPTSDDVNLDHELAKIIFANIRKTFIYSINDATWLNSEITKFINSRLKETRLQVGIPSVLLTNDKYLKDYYRNLQLVQQFFFAELPQSQWGFEKEKMQERLKFDNEKDKIIDAMFPMSVDPENDKAVKYSPNLNMILISPEVLRQPYFSHHYPISFNIARLGADIAEALLTAVKILAEEYKNLEPSATKVSYLNDIDRDGLLFLKESNYIPESLSKTAQENIFNELVVSNIVFKTYQTVQHMMADASARSEFIVPPGRSLDEFKLDDKRRIPGLREYNGKQLVTLSYMQRFCSASSAGYRELKPLVENEISRNELFNIIWDSSPLYSDSVKCSQRGKKCDVCL